MIDLFVCGLASIDNTYNRFLLLQQTKMLDRVAFLSSTRRPTSIEQELERLQAKQASAEETSSGDNFPRRSMLSSSVFSSSSSTIRLTSGSHYSDAAEMKKDDTAATSSVAATVKHGHSAYESVKESVIIELFLSNCHKIL